MTERRDDDPPLYFNSHVFICTNRRPEGHARGSCAASGAERLRDYMKARAKELGIKGIRINSAGCLDRCERGPCMVIYPEGVWYKIATFQDADQVLQTHLVEGNRAEHLRLAAVAD